LKPTPTLRETGEERRLFQTKPSEEKPSVEYVLLPGLGDDCFFFLFSKKVFECTLMFDEKN
jgi:hypothetical protein